MTQGLKHLFTAEIKFLIFIVHEKHLMDALFQAIYRRALESLLKTHPQGLRVSVP